MKPFAQVFDKGKFKEDLSGYHSVMITTMEPRSENPAVDVTNKVSRDNTYDHILYVVKQKGWDWSGLCDHDSLGYYATVRFDAPKSWSIEDLAALMEVDLGSIDFIN